MRALSIRQPWAWLIVSGRKPIKNRTWTTTYRGPVLIHAALKMDAAPLLEIAENHGVTVDMQELQRGGIIGRVELVDVIRHSSSEWFGTVGFVLDKPQRLAFDPCAVGKACSTFEVKALSGSGRGCYLCSRTAARARLSSRTSSTSCSRFFPLVFGQRQPFSFKQLQMAGKARILDEVLWSII